MTGGIRLGIVDLDVMHGEQFAGVVAADDDPALAGVRVTHFYAGYDPARAPGTEYPGARPPLDAPAVAREFGIAHVAPEPEAMIGEVDAVLLCARFGDTHLALARPFLEAGVPVFLDKPASDSVADTREIVRLVRAKSVPFLCTSLWKFTPPVEQLAREIEALGEIRTAICTGPGPDEIWFYGTHSVETIQWLLGPGAAHVTCLADEERYAMLIQMTDGRIGFANVLRHTAVMRHIAVYCERGYRQAEIDETARRAGLRNALVRFVRTLRGDEPPYPIDLVEEATAILAAAERSMREGGRRVYLSELE